MKSLQDSIEINAPADKVFRWFANLELNYKDWHPDHRDARWIGEKSMKPGALFYAEECLHGELHKIKFRLKCVEQNKFIEFKNLFPLSLISPKGSFEFESKGPTTLFTASLSFRMGKLLSKVAKRQVEMLIQHMKEESVNLKALMEK